MIVIRAPSIGRAHELIVEKIFKDGKPVVTEDHQRTIELKEQSNIFLANPFQEPMVSSRSKYSRNFMEDYAVQLLEGPKEGNVFEYDYHSRLFHYPVRKEDGSIEEFDQIAWIVKKLSEEPDSRRAQAITWIPGKDNETKNPPCLQRVQCFLREDEHGTEKLNMLVDFRSNDMLTGANSNMYALASLQKKKIAEPLGVEVGWYSHTSDSSHLYPKSNFGELEKMIAYDVNSLRYFNKRMNELEPIFMKIEAKRKK